MPSHNKRHRSPKRPQPKSWEPSNRDLQIYADVCAGKSQGRVSRKYDLSRQRVGQLVARIDKWYAEMYMGRIREIKANHTQRLEYIFREAMAAWRRSQLDAVSETEKIGGKYGAESSTTRRGQVGAAQFLSEARAAIKEIREIWGANAPLQIEHMGEVRVAGRPIDECRSELLDRVQRITAAMPN